MRSRSTNILQGIVLFTGIVYIIIGLFFYISPIFVLKLFAKNFPEDWLVQIRSDEIVAPLYYMFRGFSSLLFTSGVAMIMPLFDPLKYRGLIYYNGLFFPLLASFIVMKSGISYLFMNKQSGQETNLSFFQMDQQGHFILLILGIVFILIFLLTLIGLIITRKQAKEGKE